MKKSTIHGTFAVSFTFAHSNADFYEHPGQKFAGKAFHVFIMQKRAACAAAASSTRCMWSIRCGEATQKMMFVLCKRSINRRLAAALTAALDHGNVSILMTRARLTAKVSL